MPEGPSIVLLKEEVQQFIGKKIVAVNGNTKIDQSRLINKNIIDFKSWGKHFLICFSDFTVKIHFLMFGSYTINKKKDKPIRLNLTFEDGEINFYTCSIKFIEGDINALYDWSADVMNDLWNPRNAKAKLKKTPNSLICDALLEQDMFSGLGNIIKNELLYRVHIHPESIVDKLPESKIRTLVKEARIYSFQFLDWKRNNELKKHWLAHAQKICHRCNLPFVKEYTGIKKRRSFICVKCMRLYA